MSPLTFRQHTSP